MSTTYAVIGANYGDEGKGLMTDFLARRQSCPDVTRFNGGAQAGHTVKSYTGTRHVFNTYGSGTLAGASTRLSQDVIVNPYAIVFEGQALLDKGVLPQPLYVHPFARVSTHFDIWLNQEAEKVRGQKHGSCGQGVNETVVRGMHPWNHSIFVKSLDKNDLDHKKLYSTLKAIAAYVPDRAKGLGIREQLSAADATRFIDEFFEISAQASDCINFKDYWGNASQFNAIYEGAQGLALDESLGHFPHVTRSTTGLSGIATDLITRAKNHPSIADMLEAVYVSRMYLTRHGNGPMDSIEHPASFVTCGNDVIDETNIPNPWQGTLRFAPLNVPELAKRIYADIGRGAVAGLKNIKPVIALTCTDQGANGLFQVILGDSGQIYQASKKTVMHVLLHRFGLRVKYIAAGPTNNDISIIDNDGDRSDYFNTNAGYFY